MAQEQDFFLNQWQIAFFYPNRTGPVCTPITALHSPSRTTPARSPCPAPSPLCCLPHHPNSPLHEELARGACRTRPSAGSRRPTAPSAPSSASRTLAAPPRPPGRICAFRRPHRRQATGWSTQPLISSSWTRVSRQSKGPRAEDRDQRGPHTSPHPWMSLSPPGVSAFGGVSVVFNTSELSQTAMLSPMDSGVRACTSTLHCVSAFHHGSFRAASKDVVFTSCCSQAVVGTGLHPRVLQLHNDVLLTAGEASEQTHASRFSAVTRALGFMRLADWEQALRHNSSRCTHPFNYCRWRVPAGGGGPSCTGTTPRSSSWANCSGYGGLGTFDHLNHLILAQALPRPDCRHALSVLKYR